MLEAEWTVLTTDLARADDFFSSSHFSNLPIPHTNPMLLLMRCVALDVVFSQFFFGEKSYVVLFCLPVFPMLPYKH